MLFDELGLPKTKRIKTGYTTDADALQWLYVQTEHPLLEHLLRRRDVSSCARPSRVCCKSVADDGRIHTTYNQTVAATGRLSLDRPEPAEHPDPHRGGPAHPRTRSSSAAATRRCSRRTTARSRCGSWRTCPRTPGLIEAFALGEDLHTTVASRVFNVERARSTPRCVAGSRRCRTGWRTGCPPYGLAQQLGIAPDEARALMDEYFERFGGVRDYLRDVVDEAADDRLHRDDARPPPLPAGPHERQPAAPRDGRADGAERAHPGVGGRRHQGRDAARRRRAAARRAWPPGCCCRCTTSCVLEVAPGERAAVEAARARRDGRRRTRSPCRSRCPWASGATWDDAAH